MMPDSIHDYTILEQLGRGGFGKVYKVESVDNHYYALKLISVTNDTKDKAKKQAELLVALNHPNILKAREFFFFNKENFLIIILEYCEEGDLCNLIGKISSESFIKKLKQIVEGLVYLHNKNIIHRDIKPENILMLKGVPKIADLGVSKIMKTSGIQTKIGSFFYLAPEVIHNQYYDNKADIWSLGIMTLELLLGKRIYDVVKDPLRPSMIEDFPSSALLNEIKNQEMRELVQMMLKKKPEERLTSQQVLQFLKGEKEKISVIQMNQYETNSETVQKLQSDTNKQQKLQIQIKQLSITYKFSEQHKSTMIQLTNNNSTATNPEENVSAELGLVEGVVLKKGSSIRFKIQLIENGVLVGLAIRNVIAANSYKLLNWIKIGHGGFLLVAGGWSFSHSNKEHNHVATDFKYVKEDVIEVETNEDKLCFRNETNKKEFKMKIRLTEDEWQQACFCVQLIGNGDSVSIMRK